MCFLQLKPRFIQIKLELEQYDPGMLHDYNLLSVNDKMTYQWVNLSTEKLK